MELDKKDLENLKELYKKAIDNKEEIVIYKSQKLLTGYLKYLIEYLENKFKK